MNHPLRGTIAALTLFCVVALSSAMSQPLGQIAPSDAMLVLDFERTPEVDDHLFAELSALDWASAADTLGTLGRLFGDEFMEDFELAMFEPLELFGELDEIREDLAAECPSLPTDVHPLGILGSGLLTVAVNPASPFPVLTMVARVPSDRADAAADINAALIECFASEHLTQDGTAIHILGQGSDLPLAIAQVGDVYIVASTPDAVRGVIRRAGGSDEPALADTHLWSATERFQGTGFGLAVNLAAVADLAQGTMGAFANDQTPEGYLMRRAIEAAQTLGGFAARAGIDQDGLIFERVLAVNPEGGDQELADLLLCDSCAVSRPFLAPSGTNGVASQHVPVRTFIRYVQGWLDGISDITGEDLDLRNLLQEALGLDLDTALLDWVGSEVHVATLEPFAPTLEQLIYQQPSVFIMPVASQEAAQRGLDALAEAFGSEAVAALSSFETPFAGMLDRTELDGFQGGSGMFATREQTYRDITYDRLQLGPTVDLAIGLVGSNLVVASPSSGMRSVIDTFRGEQSRLDDAAYRRVLEAAPDDATSIMFQDVGANLAGLARLGHSIAQPIAAGLAVAVQQAVVEQSSARRDSTGASEPVGTVSFGELPVQIASTLTGQNINDFGEVADRYRITGIPAGERITVSVESDAFDTYLYLLDAQGTELDSNDDAGDGMGSALTITSDGGDYLVEVNSFGAYATGPYTLTIEMGTAAILPQIELTGIEPQPLKVPASGDGELTGDDRLPSGGVGAYFALDGLEAGQRVSVVLTSDVFDTYLRVVDPENGVVLAENDDNPDTSRSAIEFGATGGPVWIQVTSWSEASTGPYMLEVMASDPTPEGTQTAESASNTVDVEIQEAPEPVEPPSFRALLNLTEIVPEMVVILSDRVGLSLGYGYVDGTVIYQRSAIEIDW